MDLLLERAEFEGCLMRIKFDRLNFMGARANSIRLSIKRTPSSRCGKINRYAFRPQKFGAAILKQNLTPHIACVNLRLQAKFYISEAEFMIHERNFVFWRNFKKRLTGTMNFKQQRCEHD